MATWEDVRVRAMRLPEVTEGTSYGQVSWAVRGKSFVWRRPLRPADVAALGDDAPDGEVMGARVADVGVKEALIADDPGVFFTTPHFDGFAAVLIRLDAIAVDTLDEVITDSWLVRAPKRLAASYLKGE